MCWRRADMPDDQHLSDLIFDLLLYLYPRSFRDAYGQQMRIAFRDYARAAKRRGRVLGSLNCGASPWWTCSRQRSKKGSGR